MPRKKTTQNEEQNTGTAVNGQNHVVDAERTTEPANIVPIQNAEKPVKRRRKRDWPSKENYGVEYVEPGDNARYLRFALDNMNRPPIDISDEKQVERRINEYFTDCEKYDMKPSVVGLSNALGIDRTTLHSWKVGECRTATHSHLVKKAFVALEELWVDYMQNGKINPASGIFIGKNHFGYRDVADVVLTPGQQLSDQTSPEQMQRQLSALPIDDDD